MSCTMIEIDCAKIAARLRVGDQAMTIGLGMRTEAYVLAPGIPVRIQPFADSERNFGNRNMTTTVIIHPHPGTGLKVKVDLVSPIDGGVNHTEYLNAGDPVKTVHASDSMAVHVSEVPDEPMQEVEGDTLPGEQIHDPDA